MLFHSHEFLYAFLPIAFLGWVFLRGRTATSGLWWLLVASLVFYGWWDPRMVLLFTTSIGLNFACGRLLARNSGKGRRAILVTAVVANLAALGYYKYADFVLQSLNGLFGWSTPLPHPALPLAISFFTFQQITYLREVYAGRSGGESFVEYALFVTFFPHLIAGPITHPNEIIPQLCSASRKKLDTNLTVGLSIFAVGMFKKVFLADSLALYADPVFDCAERHLPLSVTEAWVGTFAFTLQIYFDFSGYSDMAIGLARLFGVALPLNFDSPLKSTSHSELWRRWHMTLGRFLKESCYIPLGGHADSLWKRCLAVFVTMGLCGLWHGSGWGYVVWGALHGVILVVEKCGRRATNRLPSFLPVPLKVAFQCFVTTVLFAVTFIPFRAKTLEAAGSIAGALVALHGEAPFASTVFRPFGLRPEMGIAWIVVAASIVWWAPNTQQIMGRFRPAVGYRFRYGTSNVFRRWLGRLQFRMTWPYAAAAAVVFGLALSSMSKSQEFIYFQF